MNQTASQAHPTNKLMLFIFWLYVLIPLAWGIINTLERAFLLFR